MDDSIQQVIEENRSVKELVKDNFTELKAEAKELNEKVEKLDRKLSTLI